MGLGAVGAYGGSYIATSNPSSELDGTISIIVQPGSFFLDVAGARQFAGDIGQSIYDDQTWCVGWREAISSDSTLH